ncbi:MAG: threonine aldolase family protein [Rubripirellula sp.]
MPIQPGCQFASDNTSGICPDAFEAMAEANHGPAKPYGEDHWTERASDLIRDLFEVDCDIFFTFNGTAANSLALASMCQSYHSVIAHELAHVETDECGGPEFFSNGTKLLLVPGENGCVDPDRVAKTVGRRTDVHFPKAKVLSITQSTEVGTVYDQDALDQVHETVRRLDLNLHMDGARFANAVATLGIAPKEVTWKRGVDVLCFGGTKNGMAVGDCVVFFDRALSAEFEYRCKQAGQLASKMRYLAAPWVGLLSDGAWIRNATHANQMALKLSVGLTKLGLNLAAPVESNAVFVDLPTKVAAGLRGLGWVFYDFIGVGTSRLMCSWATTDSEVNRFLADAKSQIGSSPVVA